MNQEKSAAQLRKEHMAKWRAENKARLHEWYKNNKAKRQKQMAVWREKNKETYLRYNAEWKENNKRAKLLHVKRSHQKKAVLSALENFKIELEKYFELT